MGSRGYTDDARGCLTDTHDDVPLLHAGNSTVVCPITAFPMQEIDVLRATRRFLQQDGLLGTTLLDLFTDAHPRYFAPRTCARSSASRWSSKALSCTPTSLAGSLTESRSSRSKPKVMAISYVASPRPSCIGADFTLYYSPVLGVRPRSCSSWPASGPLAY